MQPPRDNRLTWNDEFMLQAKVASWRSPDPSTQVGAILVNQRNQIVGTGYNGFPRGIKSTALPWDRDKEDPLENKYAYVVHGEANAIANTPSNAGNCTLYVTLHPCQTCAITIAQASSRGIYIRKIIYLSNKYKDLWWTQAAVKIFELLDIQTEQHKWDNPERVTLYLDRLCQNIKGNQQ